MPFYDNFWFFYYLISLINLIKSLTLWTKQDKIRTPFPISQAHFDSTTIDRRLSRYYFIHPDYVYIETLDM